MVDGGTAVLSRLIKETLQETQDRFEQRKNVTPGQYDRLSPLGCARRDAEKILPW